MAAGEAAQRAGGEPGGRGGEQWNVEPVALVVVFRLEDAERAVVVRVLVDVERDEGEDAGDAGAEGGERTEARRVAAPVVALVPVPRGS